MQINLKSGQISSYRDLMRTMQNILYAAWGKDKVRFTSAYPKLSESNNIVPPIITYSILKKTPGEVGKNSAELKPRHREYIKVETPHGEVPVELVGQLFDYWILFELWAEDGDAADELSEKFQLFMTQYSGYLKKVGVSDIFFSAMDGDTGNPKWRSDLIRRDVIYQIRLDEVVGIHCPVIEDVVVDAIVHHSNYEMVLDILTRDDSRKT